MLRLFEPCPTTSKESQYIANLLPHTHPGGLVDQSNPPLSAPDFSPLLDSLKSTLSLRP
jgi:hypothetical protein